MNAAHPNAAVYAQWTYAGPKTGVWTRAVDRVRIVRVGDPGYEIKWYVATPDGRLIGPYPTFGDAARGC